MKLNDKKTLDLKKLIKTRLLVQANSGGGKSHLLRRILEQTHGKVQQIILDPEGEFSTLREKYDYILAGKGGDTPAEPRSAALLARKLLELRVSAVIDLYELPPQDRKKFVRLFLDAMVNAPKELYHEVLVVIDEAHVFVPEKEQSEAAGSVIDLCTRGRKRGFCAVLATQRISKIAKDAAAECNNKLIGRTGLDIDMKRAAEELGFTSKEQMLSLRKLQPGEFYAFGPAISDEVELIKIGDVKTSHPEIGTKSAKLTPPTEKIKKVLGELADLPQEAEKEALTVVEMRKENARLKGEVTRLSKTHKPLVEYITQVDVKREKEWGIYAREVRSILQAVEKNHDATKNWIKKLADLKEPQFERKLQTLPKVAEKQPVEIRPSRAIESVSSNSSETPLSKGAKSVLTYLHNVYPAWKSKAQLWIAAGYAPGGGFNNIVYELTGAGLIEKDGAGKYASTESHSPDLIDPTFDTSLDKWDAKLSTGARKIFNLLRDDPSRVASKEELAQETGYALGGGFNNLVYELTGKELAVKEGTNYKVNPEALDL